MRTNESQPTMTSTQYLLYLPQPRLHHRLPARCGLPPIACAPRRAPRAVGRAAIVPRAFSSSASLSPASTPSNRRRLVPRKNPPLSRPLGHAPAVLFFPPNAGCGGRAALRAAIYGVRPYDGVRGPLAPMAAPPRFAHTPVDPPP